MLFRKQEASVVIDLPDETDGETGFLQLDLAPHRPVVLLTGSTPNLLDELVSFHHARISVVVRAVVLVDDVADERVGLELVLASLDRDLTIDQRDLELVEPIHLLLRHEAVVYVQTATRAAVTSVVEERSNEEIFSTLVTENGNVRFSMDVLGIIVAVRAVAKDLLRLKHKHLSIDKLSTAPWTTLATQEVVRRRIEGARAPTATDRHLGRAVDVPDVV